MLYRELGRTGDRLSVLGYGCMRFPMKNGRIDEEEAGRHLRLAIEKGVNYLDTAYIYHNGRSESFLGRFLAEGYRDRVNIATKLPIYFVHSRRDMDDILEKQLRKLATDRIDYYLMHSVIDMQSWERLKKLGVEEFLKTSKETGKINRIGFSYHGNKEDFKRIVDDYPWDFCQIQYNYLDVSSQAGLEGLRYAASKGLGIIVMEPLRGGSLVGKMPAEVKRLWEKAEIKRSPAEWALRWIWNRPEVTVVLSGMSEEEQVLENVKIADQAYPDSLKGSELQLVEDVREVYARLLKVGCTGCSYCMPCPAGVDIPKCFSYYNHRYLFNEQVRLKYMGFAGGVNGRECHAALCRDCGKCEKLCPQQIPIRSRLKDVVKELHLPFMKQLVWTAKKAFEVKSALKGK